jgi:hypothetical protein
MSHTKTLILHALLAVSALLILSTRVAASWPVKIAGGGSAQAVAVDHEGNIIASGSLSGPTLDVFKLSGEDGSIIWSYRYGLQGVASRAIVVDLNGDVIVGSSWGALIKISGVNGAELWVKSEFGEVTGVKTDESGNVFAVGRGEGVFKVIKVDSSGNLIWRYLSRLGVKDDGSGPSYDIGNALALNRSGDVIAAGVRDEDFAVIKISGYDGAEIGQQEIDGKGTQSYFFEKAEAVVVGADGTVLAAGSTSPSGNRGPSDFTVAKFSGDLSQTLWVNEIPGTDEGIDEAHALTIDSAGDVIAAGSLFNIYTDRLGNVIWVGDQFAVVKLSGSTGQVLWKELADYDNEFPARGIAYSVVVNPEGDVFATGLYNDSFTVVKKFSANGENLWRQQQMDESNFGTGRAIALDAQSNVIAGGHTVGDGQMKFTVIKLEPLSGFYYSGTPTPTPTPLPTPTPTPTPAPSPTPANIFEAALYRHMPMLRFDSNEKYLPVAVESITDNPGNKLVEPSSGKKTDRILAQVPASGNIPQLNINFLGDLYPNNEPSLERDELQEAASYENDAARLQADARYRDQIYGRVYYTRDNNGRRHAWLQYWFFSLYNDYYWRTDLLGAIKFDHHEGDWEMIQIEVDENANPRLAIYAQHESGAWRYWNEIERVGPNKERPVVYVARGSHASYFKPGKHFIQDIAKHIPRYESLPDSLKPSDNTDGLMVKSDERLVIIKDNLPGWVNWQGHWGGSTSRTLAVSSLPLPTELKLLLMIKLGSNFKIPVDGTSPRSPKFQGPKWDNPVLFLRKTIYDG